MYVYYIYSLYSIFLKTIRVDFKNLNHSIEIEGKEIRFGKVILSALSLWLTLKLHITYEGVHNFFDIISTNCFQQNIERKVTFNSY